MRSPFDVFSLIYDRFAAPLSEWQRPALNQLLYSGLEPGSLVLDLCCGTGNFARELVDRGYQVIGVDSAEAMLQIARNKVPEASFVQADASHFHLECQADAATCLFDSLNNLMDPARLGQAFTCVCSALKPGGAFVFDVNTDGAYGELWDRSFCEVQPDVAFFLRGGFDAEARIGHTEITVFRNQDGWQRSDAEIVQRPWNIPEVAALLRESGFQDVQAYRAHEDLKMAGDPGIGRAYFRAVAPSNQTQRT